MRKRIGFDTYPEMLFNDCKEVEELNQKNPSQSFNRDGFVSVKL